MSLKASTDGVDCSNKADFVYTRKCVKDDASVFIGKDIWFVPKDRTQALGLVVLPLVMVAK